MKFFIHLPHERYLSYQENLLLEGVQNLPVDPIDLGGVQGG